MQAYNTTDSPIVVDPDGRILAGHERGPVDPDAAAGALGSGALIQVDDIPDPDPARVGQPPPRSGAGSAASAWREYAAANSVTVADDAGRDEIITALDQAGVPTEVKE